MSKKIYLCAGCGHVSAIDWPGSEGFACAHCHRIYGAHIKSRDLNSTEIAKINKQYASSKCAYCKHEKCISCGNKGSKK